MRLNIFKYLFYFLILFLIVNNINAQSYAQSNTYTLVKCSLDSTYIFPSFIFTIKFEVRNIDSNDIKIIIFKQREINDSSNKITADTVSAFTFYDLDIGLYFLIWKIPTESHDKYVGIYYFQILKNNILQRLERAIFE